MRRPELGLLRGTASIASASTTLTSTAAIIANGAIRTTIVATATLEPACAADASTVARASAATELAAVAADEAAAISSRAGEEHR